ncbi:Glutamate receptor ionotropic, kainate 2 [Cryptotermes secundus]|uniref:Glutamate receptor 1 n=1 Tax=Cryptotermes secundus TaxID=105785 RepID=A0A2J7QQG3_9NEOP|nr:glutamate receptor ionotropic, kainate 2 isoform X2 [Cryptotermes secundus]PNF30825.1 Glutamate receptor ionotropic, kainate 2 [Cryptotermes secundus]
MAGSILSLLLVVILPAVHPLPRRVPIAVLFYPEDQPLQHLALRYALQYIYADPELLPGTELYEVELNMSQADSFSTGKRVCGAVSEGVAAVFGPRAPATMGIVQSICETLEVPNLQIYPEVPEDRGKCLINLHPEQESVAQAIADVVRFLRWSSFTVLYETDEGLIRLQEVLKRHGPGDPQIAVRQFLPGTDQRQLLKEVNASSEFRILLDCSVERVLPLLRQAREVRMMSDYHSYFITSLDTHTLDLSEFQASHTNITLLRLVDPENITVQRVVRFWTEKEQYYNRSLGVTAQTVRTETALMHDAVFLFARALHRLYFEPNGSFQVQSLGCDVGNKWAHGFRLASYMKINEVDGMTGKIRFDTFGRRSHFELGVVEYFAGKFQKVGSWELGRGVARTQSASIDAMDRLQNKTFLVSSRIGEPFLMHNKEPGEHKDNDRYVGYSMDLMKEIAKVEPNFQFEFRLVPNNKHGELVDDLIARRTDLAICDLTITHEREQVIDFTMPFMNLGISILFSKPVKEETPLFAFLKPFSIDVWIYVATAYLGVSILLFVLARTTPGEWDNPHPCKPDPEELENKFNLMNCLWFSIGSLMGQGCDILPKAVSTRMVAGMWWFFTLIMCASYTANLAAFLTLNRLEGSISSAEDLAKQHKVKYGTMAGGSTASFFKNSNDSTYKRMYTTMSQSRPSVFVNSNEEGVERVQKGKGLYAFFMESTSIEYQVERKCDLQQVGGLLDSKGYGIGMPVNSPYRTMVSGAVLKLQEKGVLQELKSRWWKVQQGGVSCSEEDAKAPTEDSNKLGLANVGGVFVVLIAGTCAAFLMAVLELLWNCRKIAVQEKISPCEALLSELKFAMNCSNANKPVRRKLEQEDDDDDENAMPVGVSAGSFVRLGFGKLTQAE